MDELSDEKSAVLDMKLSADSGYTCTHENIRISPKQWIEINEIIFRKEEA